MRGCTLKNNRKLSEKIFNGTSTKNVCGWILCKSIEIRHSDFIKESDFKIRFNPKIAPFWMFMGDDVDNKELSYIVSVDYKLCIDFIPDAMKLGGYAG